MPPLGTIGTLHTFMTQMKIAGKWLTSIVIAMVFSCSTGIVAAEKNFNDEQPLSSFSVNTAQTFVEGPHIFYKKGHTIVKNVHFSREGIRVDEKKYSSKDDVPTLTCYVDNRYKTSFTVSLRSKHQAPETVYPQPDKLYAISDIEGNFEAFEKSLKGNGIIDKNLDWKFGKGHLVLVGDFFDRGYNVTPVLWLIYKLEQQAAEAGGMVHFIVGNHEEMNMRGDVRYVKDKYKKAAKVLKIPYRSLYSKDTELGRWLRSKNVVEKIGKTIFVHGGLSPEMANARIRLESMNKYAREYYGMDKFRMDQRGGSATRVFSKVGPMWYRGYFKEELTQQEVNQTLGIYGANHVVVGHTIVPKVSSLFEGKVIAIDVKHNISLIDKISNSIFIEKGKIYACNVDGKRSSIERFMTEDIIRSAFKAVKDGDVTSLNEFLETSDKYARINKHYFSKRITLLQAAIRHNQPAIVDLLIESGADIDMLSENKTPLMHAIEANNPLIIDILIYKGANINGLNKQKKSPLFFCAKYDNVEIAKVLVEKGARLDIRDGKGRTAIEYALKNENTKIATYLKNCKN